MLRPARLIGAFAIVFACSSSGVLAQPTNVIGGDGGDHFLDQCQGNDYLVGIRAEAGKDLNQIAARCRHFEGNEPAGDTYDLNTWGQHADSDVGAIDSAPTCQSGDVVVGMKVEASNAQLVHRFKLTCSPLGNANPANTLWSRTVGGEPAATGTVKCGNNEVAAGILGNSGALVNSLGLLCVATATLAAADTTPPIIKYQTVMLESTNFPGMFIRHRDWQGLLTKLESDLDYKDATFNLSPALTHQGKTAVSFESEEYPGMYLRHKNFVLVLEKNDGSQQFAQDASFTRIKRTGSKGNEFESVNFPGLFIRHKNFKLVLEKGDGSAQFNADATFVVEAPIASAPPNNEDNPPPPENGNDGGQQATARDYTTAYVEKGVDDEATNKFLDPGQQVTIITCEADNWCQLSKPYSGYYVWGDDLNH